MKPLIKVEATKIKKLIREGKVTDEFILRHLLM